jgi:hypothetical protein
VRRRRTRACTSTRPDERGRTPAAGAAKAKPGRGGVRPSRPPIGRDTDHAPAPASCRRASLPPRPTLPSSSSSSRSGCQQVRTLAVWLGRVRPRAGPAVSGAVSGGWAPRARYLGCLLCRRPPRVERERERETNRCFGSAPRELFIHVGRLLRVVFARLERYRASLSSLPPFLALFCFPTTRLAKRRSHGKGERTRLLFSGLLCYLPRLWS